MQGLREYPITAADPNRYDPEELRRKVVTGGCEEFAEGLIAALKPRIFCDLCKQSSGYNRWAFNLFAKVAKLTQSEAAIAIAIFAKFGARDETELKALVSSGRRMEQLVADSGQGLERYRDEALELLSSVLRQHPEWRQGVLERLGGSSVNGDGS